MSSFDPKLDEDEDIPSLNIKASHFLRQTTVLYGDSNTGKSTIIYHIFSVIRKYIPIIIVISPTAASNGDYDDRVPDVLIFKEASKELLKAIYSRQEAAASIFRQANDVEVLKSLYKYVRDSKTDNIARTVQTRYRIAINRAKREFRSDHSKLEEEIENIKETHDDALRNIYRVSVRKHRDYLLRKKLNKHQETCLKYLDFNPGLCLVMDDCAAQIKAWGKDETIGKIFYQGRHNFITSIYTFQHDKLLDTTFRQNAFISIFTSDKSARAFFNRSSNNFEKSEVKKVESIIVEIFKKGASHPIKFQKLVYMRQAKQPYLKYIAKKMPKFKVCFPYVQKYCELVKSNEDYIDPDNPFMLSFMSTS
jgi:hypothetical protein